jgi:hypothetical protein
MIAGKVSSRDNSRFSKLYCDKKKKIQNSQSPDSFFSKMYFTGASSAGSRKSLKLQPESRAWKNFETRREVLEIGEREGLYYIWRPVY